MRMMLHSIVNNCMHSIPPTTRRRIIVAACVAAPLRRRRFPSARQSSNWKEAASNFTIHPAIRTASPMAPRAADNSSTTDGELSTHVLSIARQSSSASPIATVEKECTAVPDAGRSYHDAIALLNTLQSNAAALHNATQSSDYSEARKNLNVTVGQLEAIGVTLDDIDGLNVIHVSGTKGKGSTCAYVDEILRRRGYRTGLFTSPHLVAVRERIRVEGKPLSERAFADQLSTIYDALLAFHGGDRSAMPSYFRFLTVLAFYVFKQAKVDVAIIEVGIGGEFDNTNVIRRPIVCGVTSLGYDHTRLLGKTLPEIAWHKAGIFKPNSVAITVPQHGDCMPTLLARAKERRTQLYLAPPIESYAMEKRLSSESSVQYWNMSLALQLAKVWEDRRRLRGAEAVNVALATEKTPPADSSDTPMTLAAFSLDSIVQESMAKTRWSGRFDVRQVGNVEYFLDGAHTMASIGACRAWFDSRRSTPGACKKSVLIFNSTSDRKIAPILGPLITCHFDYVLFTPNLTDRTSNLSSDNIAVAAGRSGQLARCRQHERVWRELITDSATNEGASAAQVRVVECMRDAIDTCNRLGEEASVQVLVTGSLYLVGTLLSIVDPDLCGLLR